MVQLLYENPLFHLLEWVKGLVPNLSAYVANVNSRVDVYGRY